ncbi:M81 family metallopeptidase [Aurantiacibacter gangjinensis]|uniref:Microcystinase C n=1 Tax=Aurantiacibacter gangjinensis TaxID=502682 RepID=A0A0G9MQA2_9SPHN|nr:M81 family metallopeptidase [Aurantiacibacter gangjinensis]KLE31483.1 hypothetical protein AAW01_07860 [Aurantiacibacter gangjinensis]
MGHVFIAGLMTETNTFSPIPTDDTSFEEQGLFRGDGTVRAPEALHVLAMTHWRERAEAGGCRVTESIAAFAQPAGPALADTYVGLRDDILFDLRAAGPVDCVLLNLHGAMTAEGTEDCEGDLLSRVREIVGPGVAVGALLDLHAHLTPAMIAASDLLVAYKHYPHDDIVERAAELYVLVHDIVEGRIDPVAGVADCRMIGLWPTSEPAMTSLVEQMKQVEHKEHVVSASLVHGFPWGDVPHAGSRALVYADADRDLAETQALELAEAFFAMRGRSAMPHVSLDKAIDFARAGEDGLTVLADVSDNAGGGAPSDSTFLLAAMLEGEVTRAASGCYYDPEAVEACFAAGEGEVVELRLGGRHGELSGEPLALGATVLQLKESHWQTGLGGSRVSLGRCAAVQVQGVAIVICSLRAQVFAPDAFTGIGVELSDIHCVAVKSTQHFHSRFAPIAKRILYVATPGAISPRYDKLGYERRDTDVWPLVEDPAQPRILSMEEDI